MRLSQLLFYVFCAHSFGACGWISQAHGQSDEPLPHGALLRLKSSGDDATIYQLRFSPSGSLLATRDMDQVVRIWEIPSGRERFALEGHVDRISSIEFSPDEQLLVTASPGQNEQIHVWGLRDGNLLRKIRNQPSQLTFDADGSLITAGVNGFATYDVRTGQPRPSRRLSLPKRFTSILALNARQNLLSYSMSSQIRSASPNEVFIRDLETGIVVHREDIRSQVASVALAPDGEHAAICTRGKKDGVTLVSLHSDVSPFVLPDHKRQTLVARFSRDSHILATASWDGMVRLWDVLTGAQIASLTASSGHALAVDFSANNRWVVTAGASEKGASTLVWDMRHLVYGITPESDAGPSASDRLPANLISVLASREVVDAYRTIGRLVTMGDDGLELARQFIDPLTVRLTDEQIDVLVLKLNSESYQERQSAYSSLLRVRRLAADRLVAAMRRAPTLEVELRLKKLLSTNAMTSLVSDSEYRQLYRLIQFLELSGNAKARALILNLARGHADGRVSKIANQSLRRLAAGSDHGA